MIPGWRARLHYWTRHKATLVRMSAIIVVTGFGLAALIQILKPSEPSGSRIHRDATFERLREAYRQMEGGEKHRFRQMGRWLCDLGDNLPDMIERGSIDAAPSHSEGRDLQIGVFDLAALIDRHAPEAARPLCRDFAQCCLGRGTESEEAMEARSRIEGIAEAEPPPPMACEFLASLLAWDEDHHAALQALIREGQFPDAGEERVEALAVAVKLREVKALEDLSARPGWLDAAPPLLVHHVGALTGDVWMQWRGLFWHRVMHFDYVMLSLAFFATGLWYVLLVQNSPAELSWRWARPAAPVMAGVCSVWPTLAILAYQEYHLGFTEDAPFPHDLWYYLAGVGLREELCKLLLLSLFLPWLVWRRDECVAVLTAAFVGLGFALEENMNYYQEYGGAVSLARFLTANFLHAALTGIAGHGLYRMLVTRFGEAERFIITFLGVVVAHGLYDWMSVAEFGNGGMSWFSILILAAIAHHFFDLLSRTTRRTHRVVSSAAVFLLGTALLVAAVLVLASVESDDWGGVSAAGMECVSLAPLALIYWRKFELG